MFRRKFLMAAFVAAIAALAGPATSQAAFTVTIDDGSNPPLVFAGSGAGIIGGYAVTVTVVSNSPGTALSFLSNTAIAVSAIAPTPATVLTITAVDNAFTNFPAGQAVSVFTSASASTLQGTGTFSTELNGVTVPGSTVVLPGPGQDDTTAAVSIPSNPYSLGNKMVLNLAAFNSGSPVRANVTLDSNLTAVPAPAGLILAATALPFVGLLRRRLRKPEATTAA